MSGEPRVGDRVLYVLIPQDGYEPGVRWIERTQPGNESLVVRAPTDREDKAFTLLRWRSDSSMFAEDLWYAPAENLRVVARATYTEEPALWGQPREDDDDDVQQPWVCFGCGTHNTHSPNEDDLYVCSECEHTSTEVEYVQPEKPS